MVFLDLFPLAADRHRAQIFIEAKPVLVLLGQEMLPIIESSLVYALDWTAWFLIRTGRAPPQELSRYGLEDGNPIGKRRPMHYRRSSTRGTPSLRNSVSVQTHLSLLFASNFVSEERTATKTFISKLLTKLFGDFNLPVQQLVVTSISGVLLQVLSAGVAARGERGVGGRRAHRGC